MRVNFYKNTAIYAVGDVLNKSVILIAVPIIVSISDINAYANFELTLSIISVLTLIFNPGISNAVVRNYWKHEKKQNLDYNWAVVTGYKLLLIFISVISVLFLTFSLIAKYFFEIQSEIFSILNVIVILITASVNQLTLFNADILKMKFQPIKQIFVNSISKFFCISALTYCIFEKYIELNEFFIFQIPFICVGMLLSFLFIDQKIWVRGATIKGAWEFFKYGFPFLLTGATLLVFGIVDKWMLLYFHDEQAVAFYSLAFRYSLLLTLVPYSLSQTWSALIHKIYQDKKFLAPRFYADFLIFFNVLTALLCAFTLLFADAIVLKTVGTAFDGSILPFAFCAFGVFFQCTQMVTAYGITVTKNSKYLLFAAVFGAGTNIAFNFLLIPDFAATGASVSSCIGYFVYTATAFYFSNKLLPLNVEVKNLRKMFLIIILIFSGIFLMHSFGIKSFDLWYRLLGFTAICLLVYFLIFYNNRLWARIILLLGGRTNF